MCVCVCGCTGAKSSGLVFSPSQPLQLLTRFFIPFPAVGSLKAFGRRGGGGGGEGQPFLLSFI